MNLLPYPRCAGSISQLLDLRIYIYIPGTSREPMAPTPFQEYVHRNRQHPAYSRLTFKPRTAKQGQKYLENSMYLVLGKNSRPRHKTPVVTQESTQKSSITPDADLEKNIKTPPSLLFRFLSSFFLLLTLSNHTPRPNQPTQS